MSWTSAKKIRFHRPTPKRAAVRSFFLYDGIFIQQ
jgi:hypothetical protein